MFNAQSGVTGAAGSFGGGSSVFVRGFDFGTTADQIASHMGQAGTIQGLEWVDDGAVKITYTSAQEAQAAVQGGQQTIIEGNSRYIDVILIDPQAFVAESNIPADKARQFLAMTPQQQQIVMAKGTLSTARDPTAVLIKRMKQARGGAGGSGVNSAGGNADSISLKNLAGPSSVLVRGFDFGTTEEQITKHMSQAGTVQNFQFINDGAACVKYGSTQEAQMAIQFMHKTVIDGNSRYIDVLVMPQASSAGGKGSNVGFGGLSAQSSVLVRGFDFGTTEEQIRSHMSEVGTIQSLKWIDDGSVSVTYTSAEEAQAAAQGLQQTMIGGNSRYIDVLFSDPQAFVTENNIDPDKASQFLAMPPQQQQAVMAKGTLATARDPNAVLVTRMNQARGAAGGKGAKSAGGKGINLGLSSPNAQFSVLVRGFDFGTTDEQIASHMSQAGTIQSLEWVDDGSVKITYTSAQEAQAAVSGGQQTIIQGNSRYIDVILIDVQAFVAENNIDADKAAQFLAMTPQQQQLVMVKGTLSTARDPNAVLVTRMNQARGAAGGSGSQSAGGKGGNLSLGNLAGQSSVLVRGFDFGTNEEQITSHMSQAGTVQNFKWVDDGSVCLTYSSAQEAQTASQYMQQTVIAGNSRYIDVLVMDSQAFLSGHNIDEDKIAQFSALTPQQQQAIMAKGTLATARDPAAVLVQRMNQVKGAGKGSFGPAEGCGGGTRNGPYGGGDTGKGGSTNTNISNDDMEAWMRVMAMMAKEAAGRT